MGTLSKGIVTFDENTLLAQEKVIPMSKTALETLRLIFNDQPDLLEIIKLGDIESERLVNSFRENNELFAAPVNLYVTGRTGAGKTSLGNRLLAQSVMESTGYIDCTDSVGFFKLASNLCYYDLPGAGSNESYENLNRSALLMPQIEDEFAEPPITYIDRFKIKNFTKCPPLQKLEEKYVTVNEWQLDSNQQLVAPDVILYAIAPHMQFLSSDRKYLGQLLKTQKQRIDRNKVIFALNIFRLDGKRMPTQQNLEDVRKHITQIYEKFYHDTPPIVEFDALTGDGINEITAFICQVLPKEKIGNIQQVLRNDLKQFAEQERSLRYMQTLIKIASRLATYKIDYKAGNQDLLQVAASSISAYGVSTFKNQEEIAQIKAELNALVESVVQETRDDRTKYISVTENILDTKELSRDIPLFEEKKVIDYIEVNETRVLSLSKFKKIVNMITGILPFGAKLFDEKIVNETVRKPIERLENRFVGYEKEVIGTVEVVVGQVEKIVGKEYLLGGYPVIKFLLGLGLGIKTYCSQPNRTLQVCLEEAEAMLERKLFPIKTHIEQLVEREAGSNAEQELIQILNKALV